MRTAISFPTLAPLALTLILSTAFACTAPLPTPQEPISIEAPRTQAPATVNPAPLQTITFGSCNKQDLPQPLWRKLAEEKSELFIWTGDTVYADTSDMQQLARIYRQQLAQPEYSDFLSSGVRVIGVYDDHDYGENNGGASFAAKVPSAQLFLDFVGEPKDSPRRRQAGIYTAYRFGPVGQRSKILLLDTRFHRSPPGADADLLGAAQWAWLEAELRKPDAELVLLVSSIQILPFEHRFEKWSNFPKSRQRLLDLIDSLPGRPPLLLSGDRHFAEFTRLTLPSGRTISEVTSSGLTHSYQAFDPAKNNNSLRVDSVLTRLNYGILKVDWQRAKVRIEVRDINRQAMIQQELDL